MAEWDVVIVGAGPAGSCLARLCAERGWSVLLLEKEAYSGKTVGCGGLLSKHWYEQFVTDPSILEQEITQTDFVFPWGTMSSDLSLVTVKRCCFDRHLANNAAAAGVTLLNNTIATDFEVQSSGKVVVKTSNGARDTVESHRGRVCIFADGPFSLARKMPAFNPEPFKNHWSFAFAYELEGVTLPENNCKIFLDPEFIKWGYAWIFPNRTQMNVGLGTVLPQMKDKRALKQRLDRFFDTYHQSAPYLKGLKIVRRNGGFIPMHPQKRIYDDSIALIGDAAGMVTALFGAGLDYGMQAATILTDVLDKALKENDCSKRRLREYQKQAYPGILRELKRQSLASKIIVASMNAHGSLPVKLLSIMGFGNNYSRWNKVRTLFYPALGRPTAKKVLTFNPTLDIKA